MKISMNVSLLLAALFFAVTLQAQSKMSWKKHVKLADELYKNAQYADAGNHYQAAWRQKTKKKELIYKAGECFYTVKDYKSAAEAFENVKDENSTYPLIGLKYARCLKQAGQYEDASQQLAYFINNYNETDKQLVSQIVQNEIKGCELAMRLASQPENPEAEIRLLGSSINTPETEFAPFPFSDDILYFSSTMSERAEIYRSQKINGQWSRAQIPESFPTIPEGHFCNGTLTPDQKRFYFTICESVESWGGLTTRCEIHVTARQNDTWTTPEKLREYINMAGVTTTHPYVVHQDNTEILYFATNRDGGKGGMDIWYATRDVRSNDNDFTFPINAGSQINTLGDEITPYYDANEGVLYFASNGHVGIGGYDIFRSKGAKSAWEKPENMKKPFNTNADDFFYVKTPSRKGGFLVSNRTFGIEKLTTVDEDIFTFSSSFQKEIYAKGAVYERETGELLTDVSVGLYELVDNGEPSLILKRGFEDGNYYFDLLPEKNYILEAKKDGYIVKSYEFDTNEFMIYDDFGAPIYLEGETKAPIATTTPPPIIQPKKKAFNTNPPTTTSTTTNNSTESYSDNRVINQSPRNNDPYAGATTSTAIEANQIEGAKPGTGIRLPAAEKERVPYTSRGQSSRDNYEVVTDSPRRTGTYYKIQLIAVRTFSESHSRYTPIVNMGRLDTEYIVDKKLTRVLLADYSSYDEAKADLRTVRQYKNFERAFLVKYEDGERIGRIN